MNKLYFVDSENVGDNWVSLLDSITTEDKLLVFYTAKSPHMNYKNIVLLKNSPKEVTFIECCEGSNALDFQLCTDLGYRVKDYEDTEFIIVSNDTGFDAVVKYWSHRGITIRRIQGKACIAKPAHAAASDAHAHENVKSSEDVTNLHDTQQENVMSQVEHGKTAVPQDNTAPQTDLNAMPKADEADTSDAKAKEILYIIGKDNLQLLHESLQQLFGQKKGQSYYNAFKSDTAYTNYINKHNQINTKDKQHTYCSIVFELSSEKLAMPEDFPEFVTSTWKKKKNLNSFRAALQTKYDKALSDKYYSMIKAHVKILDKIK